MDELRQPYGATSPPRTTSFEYWVTRQFQGQDFFPGTSPNDNRELTFVSAGNGAKFTIECIWKKILSGPWKWTAIPHPNEKEDEAARHFMALGIGGTPQSPDKVFFIHLQKATGFIYISEYRLSKLELLNNPAEVAKMAAA